MKPKIQNKNIKNRPIKDTFCLLLCLHVCDDWILIAFTYLKNIITFLTLIWIVHLTGWDNMQNRHMLLHLFLFGSSFSTRSPFLPFIAKLMYLPCSLTQILNNTSSTRKKSTFILFKDPFITWSFQTHNNVNVWNIIDK